MDALVHFWLGANNNTEMKTIPAYELAPASTGLAALGPLRLMRSGQSQVSSLLIHKILFKRQIPAALLYGSHELALTRSVLVQNIGWLALTGVDQTILLHAPSGVLLVRVLCCVAWSLLKGRIMITVGRYSQSYIWYLSKRTVPCGTRSAREGAMESLIVLS
jgi:hypothetical protein